MLSIWTAQLERLVVVASGLKKIELFEPTKTLPPEVDVVDSPYLLELGEIPWKSSPVVLIQILVIESWTRWTWELLQTVVYSNWKLAAVLV